MSECTHNCETCSQACASRQHPQTDFHEPPHQLSSIKKVIGVCRARAASARA